MERTASPMDSCVCVCMCVFQAFCSEGMRQGEVDWEVPCSRRGGKLGECVWVGI